MADCIPIWEEGDRITATTTTTVTGCTLVAVSAAANADGTYNVGTCGANAKALGVAAFDQVLGGRVGVLAGKAMIVPVVVGAAVTFGTELMSDASGRVIPWDAVLAHAKVGYAMSSQPTVGSTVPVQII